MTGVKELAKVFWAGCKAHKAEIMIGAGVIAGGAAIVVAIKETPKCLEAFDKAEAEQPLIGAGESDGEVVELRAPLDWKQKTIIYAKSYWKAALLEAGSIILIVWGTKIRLDGYTAAMALITAYKAERDDLRKIIDAHPDNWKKKFQEKAAEVHMDETSVSDVPAERMTNAEVPMPMPLFWDDHALVYFRMSEEDLRDAVAEFTHTVVTDPFQATTLNQWMSVLGHEDVVNGDYIVMTSSPGYSEGVLKYQQIGVKEAPTGEPARMMRFTWDFHVDTRALSVGTFGDI